MSFLNNDFFAGCESLMEDETVAEETPVEEAVPVEDAVAEQTETADEAQEVTEAVAEQEQEAAQVELVFRKFDEIDRMVAYVKTYGVDRSFLNLCNHNDILNKSFHMTLPACESFDAVGSPNSAESIAAMEGLKEAASKFWAWIKSVLAKIRDFFKRMWAKITGFFSKKADKAKEATSKAAKTKELPADQKKKSDKESIDSKAVIEANNTIEKEAKAAIADLEKANNPELVAKAKQNYAMAASPKDRIDELLRNIRDKRVRADQIHQADVVALDKLVDELKKEAEGYNAAAQRLNADITKAETTVKNAENRLKGDLDAEDKKLESELHAEAQAQLTSLKSRQQILLQAVDFKKRLISAAETTAWMYMEVNTAADKVHKEATSMQQHQNVEDMKKASDKEIKDAYDKYAAS